LGHALAKPILMVVDDTSADLEAIQRELVKRYGDDYEVAGDAPPQMALHRLETPRAAGTQRVFMLAAQDDADELNRRRSCSRCWRAPQP
jgi:hypothetical protein